jgi:hypothetical protein
VIALQRVLKCAAQKEKKGAESSSAGERMRWKASHFGADASKKHCEQIESVGAKKTLASETEIAPLYSVMGIPLLCMSVILHIYLIGKSYTSKYLLVYKLHVLSFYAF